MRKKSFAVFMAILMCSIVLCGRLAEAKSTSYWLHAGYYSNRVKLVYMGNKIKIFGWWQKGKSFQGAMDGKKRLYSKRFKVSKNCKVVEVEEPRNHTYSLRKYIKKRGIRKGQSILNVENYIKIKKGKIVKIEFSA